MTKRFDPEVREYEGLNTAQVFEPYEGYGYAGCYQGEGGTRFLLERELGYGRREASAVLCGESF